MRFQIVDAFTDKTFDGNPGGVVLLPGNGNFPDDETVRKTAAELRYSEAAFIKPQEANRSHIRYFNPVAEVALCGHATIGGFHALRDMGLVFEGRTAIAETQARTLESVVGCEAILMDMAGLRPLRGWTGRNIWKSRTVSWAPMPLPATRKTT